MDKIGIVGLGEIGSAVREVAVAAGVRVVEKEVDTNPIVLAGPEVTTLHICIPFSERFIKEVAECVYLNIKTIFVHSTVPPGTCRKLQESLSDDVDVIHAPVRGLHPNLASGLLTFPMFLGARNKQVAIGNSTLITRLGIFPHAVNIWEESELAKVLDTTYYGVCIAFHDYAAKLADEVGADFHNVMTEYNRGYNEGYTKLGKPEVVRPVLYPPKGSIGGHCVTPNANLLEETFGEHPLLKAILDLA